MRELVSRHVARYAEEFLDAFRVVIVNGPRQSGKTTLLQQLNVGWTTDRSGRRPMPTPSPSSPTAPAR
ncbi:hypothetical protein ACFY19_27950 [Streptosporangium saharense]|uniref:hypothetical protein n=1 Tax=Streptosporangium saharense TaxID=1706840 RepID=UPI0036A30615